MKLNIRLWIQVKDYNMQKKFFTIGKIPGYNNNISSKMPYEDRLLPSMAFIDLTPRTLKFNKDSWKKPKTFINDVLTYSEKDHPMIYFNKVMKKHKKYLDSYNPSAKYDGIRFVATIDSAINNSISHNYDSNILDTALGGIKEAALSAMGGKAAAHGKKAIDILSNMSQALKMMDGNQYNGDAAGATASGFLDAFAGHRVHMPRMWTSSSVQDALQLSVKLTSPSGDPKSIKRYIIEPLVIIFIMSSPLTLTGTDLTMPFIYEVDAHGMGHYKLAGITNINFDRGGTDVDFNIYQQPLTVNVRLSIMPLANDAVTSLGKTDFYSNAWFQTPESIFNSMKPKKDFAKSYEKFYKKKE